MDFKVHSLNVPPTEIITTFYEETSFQRSDHCLLVQGVELRMKVIIFVAFRVGRRRWLWR